MQQAANYKQLRKGANEGTGVTLSLSQHVLGQNGPKISFFFFLKGLLLVSQEGFPCGNRMFFVGLQIVSDSLCSDVITPKQSDWLKARVVGNRCSA